MNSEDRIDMLAENDMDDWFALVNRLYAARVQEHWPTGPLTAAGEIAGALVELSPEDLELYYRGLGVSESRHVEGQRPNLCGIPVAASADLARGRFRLVRLPA